MYCDYFKASTYSIFIYLYKYKFNTFWAYFTSLYTNLLTLMVVKTDTELLYELIPT